MDNNCFVFPDPQGNVVISNDIQESPSYTQGTNNTYSTVLFVIDYMDEKNKGIIGFVSEANIINYQTLNDMYLHYFSNLISPTLNKAITQLLKNRDFMGYQLDYKSGNIKAKEFQAITKKYLTPPEKVDLIYLKKQIMLLMKVTDKTYNSDELSVMLNCDIEEVEKALDSIITSR